LVFFTVVHGIASAGDIKRVGKVGWRAYSLCVRRRIEVRVRDASSKSNPSSFSSQIQIPLSKHKLVFQFRLST
jgi:hypothetical protein